MRCTRPCALAEMLPAVGAARGTAVADEPPEAPGIGNVTTSLEGTLAVAATLPRRPERHEWC